MSERVKVVVRCRPPNAKEQAEGKEIVLCDETTGLLKISEMFCACSCELWDNPLQRCAGQVVVNVPQFAGIDSSGPSRMFTFDAVFGSSSSDIFSATALPIVESVLEGYNGTIFAYGQTGSGRRRGGGGVVGCGSSGC
jgi:Kinesin motor domain